MFGCGIFIFDSTPLFLDLAAELAGLPIDDFALADGVRVERDAGPRRAQQLASPALRTSTGSRRRSSPPSSSRSKAQSTAERFVDQAQ